MKNMREIKFRAWDKKRQVMIGTDYPNNWGNNKEEWYCDVDMMDLIGIENINSNDKFELMQFTGLKDKNGVEIYEGDILIVKDYDNKKTKGHVEYMECYAGYGYSDKNFDYRLSSTAQMLREVIGNVHQNPELLT